tara:strand:- start:1671 stop:3443 length:1773 start_codon:yes stop_codon:yes gene_type:complete
LIILGLSCYFHDSSAVIIQDGELICAAEEERFSRKKHDFGFPENAIQFCLKKANIDVSEIDYIVFFEKPFLKFERILKTVISTFPMSSKIFTQGMRAWALDKLWIKNKIASYLDIDAKIIRFSEHHLSHSASSYFCSPFNESALVTFDGVGEWASTTIGKGNNNDINILKEIHFPHSIGLLYSAFTAFLGFEVNEGEYKVMGMAPFGKPKYTDKINEIITSYEDGSFWLDMSYFSYHKSASKSFTKKFENLFGIPREPESYFFTKETGFPDYFGDKPKDYELQCESNQFYADIAASIQQITEELMLSVCLEAYKITGSKNLCMAGGVALNSTANNRIINELPFDNVFIQPASGDGGGALGAALLMWNHVLNNKKRFVMDNVYYGEEYDDDQIMESFNKNELNYKFISSFDDLAEKVAMMISEGKVIGWFQGRFEWGPRSLGARSIIADPRKSEMKNIVNTKIKFREPFRPFAPSILSENVEEYFELIDNQKFYTEQFMLRVAKIKENKRSKIPAVDHFGTGRLQSVKEDSNPRYYKLIKSFYQLTGVPVIMNTSFNVRGEPIVNTPEEALNTFLKTDIDVLVCGNYIIEK